MSENYINHIVSHYENCLDKHGDNHLGVDWPKEEDAKKRYQVMLDVIYFAKDFSTNKSLLDFGCGAAHFYEFIKNHQIKNVEYTGLDISEKFTSLSKKKYPHINFVCADILKNNEQVNHYDYIVMNGVFTEKRELSFDEMWSYFNKMLITIFAKANKGIAFNIMSKAVDWEREDLFHVSTDLLINFLTKNLTRNFIIRSDYGLYEYTTYVYK